jgi:hypothetical protein
MKDIVPSLDRYTMMRTTTTITTKQEINKGIANTKVFKHWSTR